MDQPDILRHPQATLLNGPHGAQTLHVHRRHDGIQLWIFVQQLPGALVAVFKAVPGMGTGGGDLRQLPLGDGLLVALISGKIGGYVHGAVDESDFHAALVRQKHGAVMRAGFVIRHHAADIPLLPPHHLGHRQAAGFDIPHQTSVGSGSSQDNAVHKAVAQTAQGLPLHLGALLGGADQGGVAQLAEMLVPIMGNAARYIMGIALLGAGFSSLLGNTQRGMVLLGAGFNRDISLESKFVRIGCILCLAFGAIVCYLYGGSPTQLIFLANLGTSVSTPVAGLFITLLIWRKDVNEGYKAPTALRICMTISYAFVLIMTASALIKLFS